MKLLKKGAGHKLLQSRAQILYYFHYCPWHVWVRWGVPKSYVRCNIRYELLWTRVDQVGCVSRWNVPFPGDVPKLCHYLGPSIDIGLAMTWTSAPQINIQTIGPRQDSRKRWVRYLRAVHGQNPWKIGVLGPAQRVWGHLAREHPIV